MSAEKLSLFQEWFTGDHVLIHLDSRIEEVIVPDNLKSNHSLTLKLSRLFQGQCEFDENDIRAYLKFDGVYRECVLPWKAVWGMTSAEGEQRIWSNDLPAEVIASLAVTKLREIGARILGRGKEEESAEEKSDSAPTKKKPPTLRRVK